MVEHHMYLGYYSGGVWANTTRVPWRVRQSAPNALCSVGLRCGVRAVAGAKPRPNARERNEPSNVKLTVPRNLTPIHTTDTDTDTHTHRTHKH